jgi:hypothetical protein
MIIEIDLVQLIKWGLNINEYLTLLKISGTCEFDVPFESSESVINSLVEKGYLILIEDRIIFTEKANKIFSKNAINFDELFELYPHKTPSGRVLRAKNKEQLGKITRDYKLLSEKYLRKVTKKEVHDLVIQATKIMLASYKKRGALDYLKKLETYINQSGWEPYIDAILERKEGTHQDFDLNSGENVERL